MGPTIAKHNIFYIRTWQWSHNCWSNRFQASHQFTLSSLWDSKVKKQFERKKHAPKNCPRHQPSNPVISPKMWKPNHYPVPASVQILGVDSGKLKLKQGDELALVCKVTSACINSAPPLITSAVYNDIVIFFVIIAIITIISVIRSIDCDDIDDQWDWNWNLLLGDTRLRSSISLLLSWLPNSIFTQPSPSS